MFKELFIKMINSKSYKSIAKIDRYLWPIIWFIVLCIILFVAAIIIFNTFVGAIIFGLMVIFGFICWLDSK